MEWECLKYTGDILKNLVKYRFFKYPSHIRGSVSQDIKPGSRIFQDPSHIRGSVSGSTGSARLCKFHPSHTCGSISRYCRDEFQKIDGLSHYVGVFLVADASVVPNDYVLPTYAVAAVANPFQHSKNASMLNNYLHLVYNQNVYTYNI